MKMNSLTIICFNLILATLLLLPYSLALQSVPLYRKKAFGSKPEPDTSTNTSSSSKSDLKEFYYKQTIDHFTYSPESYRTFRQRYYVKDTNWGGGNSPIFVYLGDEQALDLELADYGIGFIEENAPRFKALTVYIEHRFYGRSNPLGSMQKSMNNPKVRGYLNSAQALADYAEIISDLKIRYAATHSPVIVFGISYGGMTAAWFRLKYPHIAFGALASSAPILQHLDVTNVAYLQVVTKDFQDTSEHCYKTIKESWTQIMNLGTKSNGLSTLNKKMHTCSPLSMESIMYDFLFSIYISAAQYDFPPYYPVATLCKGIDNAPKGVDALDKIYAGLVSLFGTVTCFSGSEASLVPSTETNVTGDDTTLGWTWQTCSEMVYFESLSVSLNDTESMFPYPVITPFDLNETIQFCKATYGVLPRPNWIENYYGGQDIKMVLKRFGSNIIFSNGLRDPYSVTGVLEDLSDTLLAIYTAQGAHGLDMSETYSDDPEWLISMRKKEVEVIQGWLTQYYDDLMVI